MKTLIFFWFSVSHSLQYKFVKGYINETAMRKKTWKKRLGVCVNMRKKCGNMRGRKVEHRGKWCFQTEQTTWFYL